MTQIGYRVVRGPDWQWGDQDGGDGHVGTVVEVGHVGGNRQSPDKTVIVQWDNGKRTNYRVGYKGAYDLLVFDGAPAGIKHVNKRCHGCGRRGIKGIRWQCTECDDYDLCTRCYMDNVHDIQHKFRRFLTSKSTGVLIPKRANCSRSQANGIFPGAKVVRGYDWVWADQDGGNGKIGTITDTRGWQNESEGSVAAVTWPDLRSNVYRVGHRGKVDIKYVAPGKGPLYYREHLPVLGAEDTEPAPSCNARSCPFSVGDKVKVSLKVDVLKQMQKGHGGWNPKMADLVGKIGTVHRITQAGDVRVQYQNTSCPVSSSASNENNRWTFNQAALTRVPEDARPLFAVKDQVRVIDNYERVKSLQSSDHGNWNEKMTENLGQKGVVIDVYPDGDVRVKFHPHRGDSGAEWTFNPKCLIHDPPRPRTSHNGSENASAFPPPNLPPADSASSKRVHVTNLCSAASSGDLATVRNILHKLPNLIDAQVKGRSALQLAALKGHPDVVEFLLKKKARISLRDDEGDTALHCAMISQREDTKEQCVRLILDVCSCDDVNILNKKKNSSLHVAVTLNNVNWAKHVLALGCKVNLQDTEGDTAAHNCVINSDNGPMMRLLQSCPHFDPKIVNNNGFNIFHIAALKGHIEAAKAILEKFPSVAHTVKSDGFTALHLSVFNNREEMTQFLASKCPFLLNEFEDNNHTPLLFATLLGHARLVEILVRSGADMNVRRSSDDKSCLELAIDNYCQKSAAEKDSSNYFVDGDDLSIDVALASIYWKEILKILVRNKIKSTPHLVHLAIACYLVRCGADFSSVEENIHDSKVRAVLLECRQYQTMRELSSLDFATHVQLTAELPASKVTSPVPEYTEIHSRHTRTSISRRSPNNDPASDNLTQNFVTSVEDEQSFNYKARTDCMSCAEERATVVFQPCGHKIVCVECCARMKKCIKCQSIITEKADESGIPIRPSLCPSLEQQETVLKLEQQVRELKESNQCIICMERQRDTALRCGHRFCQKCAVTLRKQCPLCRKPITGTIRLY